MKDKRYLRIDKDGNVIRTDIGECFDEEKNHNSGAKKEFIEDYERYLNFREETKKEKAISRERDFISADKNLANAEMAKVINSRPSLLMLNEDKMEVVESVEVLRGFTSANSVRQALRKMDINPDFYIIIEAFNMYYPILKPSGVDKYLEERLEINPFKSDLEDYEIIDDIQVFIEKESNSIEILDWDGDEEFIDINFEDVEIDIEDDNLIYNTFENPEPSDYFKSLIGNEVLNNIDNSPENLNIEKAKNLQRGIFKVIDNKVQGWQDDDIM